MILRSILGFVLLFGVYTFLVVKFPLLSASQNQNQDNYIKAEKFLYGQQDRKVATLIGTSLSACLVMEHLPQVRNLSFAGLSPIDGLSIILNSPEQPGRVFVETNFYWEKESPGFQEPIFHPLNYYLKKYIPSLRSDKQPIAIGIQGVIWLVKDVKRRAVGQGAGDGADKSMPFQPKMFDMIIRDFEQMPDTVLIDRQIACLKQRIDVLKQRGVEVVFFEMPVHAQVYNSTKYQCLRKKFRRVFRESEYNYIPDRRWNFQTTDGIHLNYTEALQYTRYLATYKGRNSES